VSPGLLGIPDSGSPEGYEVCRRFRGYGKKDFILVSEGAAKKVH